MRNEILIYAAALLLGVLVGFARDALRNDWFVPNAEVLPCAGPKPGDPSDPFLFLVPPAQLVPDNDGNRMIQ